MKLPQTVLLSGLFLVLVMPLSGQTNDVARQRAAIQKACDAGVLTPDECRQKLAALSGGSSGQSAGGVQWREPHGRFTITVPAGWQVNDTQGNLKITNGDSWAIFETASQAGGPLAMAQHNAAQMQPMVSNWHVINQGPFTTKNSYPAAGMTVGCNVPTQSGSSQRSMLFASVGAGNDNYVTLTSSADLAKAQQVNGILMDALQSIHF